MKRRKFYSTLTAVSILLLGSPFVYGQQKGPALKRLVVFYSTGCRRCIEIKNTVLPQIQQQFQDTIRVEYRDTDDIENYKLLLSLEKSHGVKINKTPPVFYFEGNFLEGSLAARDSLIRLISQPPRVSSAQPQQPVSIDLIERFKGFRPLAIVGAGLIDGINPCAFTVIVFFISFLALQGYAKRELTFIGASFIISVFLTYLLIGIGLFGFLYGLKGFWLVARIFNSSIGIFSITLGVLAVYDFFKFKKSGKTEGLTLQLPQAVKNQIHKVIGLQYRKKPADRQQASGSIFALIWTALITGFLVSLLEAVCTGQLYVPTIAFVLKTSPLKLQALGYLLLYNLMFVLPLFVIFILALFGTTSQQFSGFLKKHLLMLKLLMAALFFSLGIFLIWKG